LLLITPPLPRLRLRLRHRLLVPPQPSLRQRQRLVCPRLEGGTPEHRGGGDAACSDCCDCAPAACTSAVAPAAHIHVRCRPHPHLHLHLATTPAPTPARAGSPPPAAPSRRPRQLPNAHGRAPTQAWQAVPPHRTWTSRMRTNISHVLSPHWMYESDWTATRAGTKRLPCNTGASSPRTRQQRACKAAAPTQLETKHTKA
jgi:hypothetical protein